MFWLWWTVCAGYARHHRLRTAVQVLAIAMGVALGFAVSLINTAALDEFGAALRQVNGDADAVIEGSRGGFDEALYARVAADPAVALASPVLETAVVVPGRDIRLTIIGLDVLQAARITPALLPDAAAASSRFAAFEDGIYLSPTALERLRLQPGDDLEVHAGDRNVRLQVRGTVPGAKPGALLGVMDLGFAQWRLGRLGRLSRITLRLSPGATVADLHQRLALPAGVVVAGPDAAASRLANLSRAYRVNLDVLALVALLTGGFLVFSLQAQATLAQRSQLAYLRAAGVTARELTGLKLAEAAGIGAVGSALGILLGIAVARSALHLLGGSLGGDPGSGIGSGIGSGGLLPRLVLSAGMTAGYGLLGVGAAMAGALVPARELARAAIAPALKAGAEEDALQPVSRLAPGLGLLLTAALLAWLPARGGIPVAAYLAIGCILLGVIALQPRLAAATFKPLARVLRSARASTRWPVLWLSINRLAGAPGSTAIGMAGIVASFGLMVAMATMVTSFRGSLEDWLVRVLPADAYARIGESGNDGWFSAGDRQLMARYPGVARVEFSRITNAVLAPDRTPVAIIARSVDTARAAQELPLVGTALNPAAGAPPPAWVSEAMTELYGLRPGAVFTLPLAGRARRFTVAGVWRDYARQFGSVIVRIGDYERLTGDPERNEAALWLEPGTDAAEVIRDLRATLPSRDVVEFNTTASIRARSLRIFDRSFVVTYMLELAAIVIGLIGIAATFSAQAIARRREFGMLRHLGVTRGQILRLLAVEGALATAQALVTGLGSGLVISLVLIEVVNPQSFHWTMDFRLPPGLLLALCMLLLACSALTAVLAGRRATGVQPLRAVHEDW